MISILTPKNDPFWQPISRRIWANVIFVVCILASPTSASFFQDLRLSDIPNWLNPILSAAEAIGETYIIPCFAFPILIVWLCLCVYNRVWQPTSRLMGALLACYLFNFGFVLIGPRMPRVEKLIQEGNEIAAACQKFRLSKGRYPGSLAQVPATLLTVSKHKNCAGAHWWIEKYEDSIQILYGNSDEVLLSNYYSKSEWNGGGWDARRIYESSYSRQYAEMESER